MTPAQMIARVRRGLGYNNGLAEDIILDALNDAQDLLEQEGDLPWFLETPDYVDLTTVAETETVAAPTGFIRLIDDSPKIWYYNESNNPVWVDLGFAYELDAVRDYYASVRTSEGSGPPVAVALQRLNFRLFPTPDAAYTLKLLYYKSEDALTADGDGNNWSAYGPHMLLNRAGMILAEDAKDDKSYASFRTRYMDAGRRLLTETQARKHNGATLERGGID